MQRQEEIDSLDPRKDCEAIMRRLVGREFPFDYQRSMIDLVFLKDLAAPRIAGLIFAGFPGEACPNRHLQASSDLF